MLKDVTRLDYVLISHFLLNLQHIATDGTRDTGISGPTTARSVDGQVSSVRFADRVIGNLGGSIRDWSTADAEIDVDEGEDEVSTSSALSDVEAGGQPSIVEECILRPTLTPPPIPNSTQLLNEDIAGPSRLTFNV